MTEKKHRVVAVIPAAGLAVRMRPLTDNCSKAMLRVNGKPTIAYILDRMFGDNCYEFVEVVIVDGKFNDIREYVERAYSGKPISFVKQDDLTSGPYGAVRIGIADLFKTNDVSVVIWLGDTIVTDEHLPFNTDFLLVKTAVEDQSAWCMTDGRKFFNKPEVAIEHTKALVGVYCMKQLGTASLSFVAETRHDDTEISCGLVRYLDYFPHGTKFDLVEVDGWYDVGSPHTYHSTCAALLSRKSRSFNQFSYDPADHILSKSVDMRNAEAFSKLHAEREWYSSLSWKQSLFCPRVENTYVMDSAIPVIVMSYEPGVLLSDLALHENLTQSTWEHYFRNVMNVMFNHFYSTPPTIEFVMNFKESARKHWLDRATGRIHSIANTVHSIMPSGGELHNATIANVLDVNSRILSYASPVGYVHGDLHMGNIVYDIHRDHFILIDPRGIYGDTVTTAGDIFYDLAKMAHDAYHGYYAIVAGRDRHSDTVRRAFMVVLHEVVRERFPGVEDHNLLVAHIINAGAVLLATCIPLHVDNLDRCQRLFDAYRYGSHNAVV